MRKINLHNFQVATGGTVRDINSRIMLNLVRQHQPVSRADLLRYSRLQRSMVSEITGQLIADRPLKAGAVDHLPRGRHPTFLHLKVGEVTRAWAKAGPVITEAVKLRSSFTQATTRIFPTDPEAKPRLRGAIALVLHMHFDVPVIG